MRFALAPSPAGCLNHSRPPLNPRLYLLAQFGVNLGRRVPGMYRVALTTILFFPENLRNGMRRIAKTVDARYDSEMTGHF
jgi:hypothetical protein